MYSWTAAKHYDEQVKTYKNIKNIGISIMLCECISMPIRVTDIKEVFWSHVRQSRKILGNLKIWAFLDPGRYNFDLSENLLKQFRNHFFTSFRTFFSFFTTTSRSRVGRGCFNTPPVGGGKSGVSVGRRLRLNRMGLNFSKANVSR